METPNNRQENPKRRGRPPAEVVANRPDPVESVEVSVARDPVSGCVCPCCGRAMVPKVLRVNASGRYNRCTLCGGQFRRYLGRDGRWLAQAL